MNKNEKIAAIIDITHAAELGKKIAVMNSQANPMLPDLSNVDESVFAEIQQLMYSKLPDEDIDFLYDFSINHKEIARRNAEISNKMMQITSSISDETMKILLPHILK